MRLVHLQKFITDLHKHGRKDGTGGLKTSSIKKFMANVSKALDYAVKTGMIQQNPARYVEFPKECAFVGSFYSVDEIEELLAVCKGTTIETPIILAVHYGLRRGELLALTWDGGDMQNNTISIRHAVSRQVNIDTGVSALTITDPKTRTGRRQIPLLPAVVPILEKHYAAQQAEKAAAGSAHNSMNLVFCSTVGGFIEPRRLNTTLEKLMKVAQVEHINFHALRHTFATRALENGVPVKVVQDVLGHADVTLTLNTYSHVLLPTAQDEISKINSIFSPAEKTPDTDDKKPKPVVKKKKSKALER